MVAVVAVAIQTESVAIGVPEVGRLSEVGRLPGVAVLAEAVSIPLPLPVPVPVPISISGEVDAFAAGGATCTSSGEVGAGNHGG